MGALVAGTIPQLAHTETSTCTARAAGALGLPHRSDKGQSDFVFTPGVTNAQPRTRAPRAVVTSDWFQVLEETDLPESTQSQYRTASLELLFCKQTRQAATIPSARQFIRDRQAQRVSSEPDRVQWQEASATGLL